MSGKVVQYGRRSKQRLKSSSSPEPSPKRQKTNSDCVTHDDPSNAGDRSCRKTLSYASPDDDDDDDTSLVPTRPNSPRADILRTPSTKPKDLSEIFAPLPTLPASPSRSPGKAIAKRMLARSNTEPFATPTSSPKPSLSATLSLPTISAISPQRSSPILSHTPPNPGVRTYSRSRSFLVALPVVSTSQDGLAGNVRLDQISIPDDDLRESYSDLRIRWGVDNSEDVPGITNELMSVTELRSRGESRRFLDEVGYLFEGLEHGMSASVKRSSILEIVLKMCDPEFVRKAKAADFVGRAWDAMRLAGAGDGDKVLDPCLAFFVALLVRNRRDIDDLVRRDDFFMTMMHLLGTEKDKDGLILFQDPISHKRTISKVERIALANLRDIILIKSSLFTSSSVPSTRLLASFSLSCLTQVPLPAQMLPPLLATLLAELAFIPIKAEGNLSETTIPCDLEHIDYCLRILDAFLLGECDLGEHGLTEQEALGKGLVSLCATATIYESEEQKGRKQTTAACQCIDSSLRVLLNLSYTSSGWCKLLMTPLTLRTVIPHIMRPSQDTSKWEEAEVAGGHDEESPALDRQCLALGLLSNIVFVSEEARDTIRDIELDPSCPRGSLCISSCKCSSRSSTLECLVHLFVQISIKSESTKDNGDLDFFRCHLAALLGLLSIDNRPNQQIIRQHLPGTARKRFGVSVHQFLEIYGHPSGNKKVLTGHTMASRMMLALHVLEI